MRICGIAVFKNEDNSTRVQTLAVLSCFGPGQCVIVVVDFYYTPTRVTQLCVIGNMVYKLIAQENSVTYNKY